MEIIFFFSVAIIFNDKNDKIEVATGNWIFYWAAFGPHETYHSTYIYESQTLTECCTKQKSERIATIVRRRKRQRELSWAQHAKARTHTHKRTNFTCVFASRNCWAHGWTCLCGSVYVIVMSVCVCACADGYNWKPKVKLSKTQTKAVKIALRTGKIVCSSATNTSTKRSSSSSSSSSMVRWMQDVNSVREYSGLDMVLL